MRNPLYNALWHLARPVILLFHPIEVIGRENLPMDEPVLLCANHSSAWDPVLLVCALWGEYPIRIMAKKQLVQIPVLGGILKMLGVIPVDRGHSDISAVKRSIQSLREGFSFLIFPEGTRVKRRGEVEPKAGAAVIAIRSGVRLVPIFIGMSKKVFRKVRIVFGEPYTPIYTGRKGTAEEYQQNVDEIMRRAYELGGVL